MKFNLPVDYTKLSSKNKKLVRLQYIEEQNNICPVCSSSLSSPPPKEFTSLPIMLELFPPFFFKYPVHLHHCHKTNMTEAAVHAYCNALLFQYEGR